MSAPPRRTTRATTRPLGQRHHFVQVSTDEMARVYGWRQDERVAEARAERLRWGLAYAGLALVMLALILAIVVLSN